MKYSEKIFSQYILYLKTQIFNSSQLQKKTKKKTSPILLSKVIFPITQSCTHDTRHLMKKESVTEM